MVVAHVAIVHTIAWSPPHPRFDKWRVDLAVTGSQKALSLPTGLAVVCASPKALEARKSATLRRVYYDFEDMLKTNPSGNVPYTPSLPLLHGLQVRGVQG